MQRSPRTRPRTKKQGTKPLLKWWKIFWCFLMFSFDLCVCILIWKRDRQKKLSHSLSAMINSSFSVLDIYNFVYIIYDIIQDYMAVFYEVKFTLPNYRVWKTLLCRLMFEFLACTCWRTESHFCIFTTVQYSNFSSSRAI